MSTSLVENTESKGGFIIESSDINDRIAKAKSGDKEAMEEIIISFTPFIIKTAKSIYIKGYDISDLIQIGGISIIKVVNMYDINRGNGFTTYVTTAIKRSLYALIRNNIKKTSYCSLNSLNEEGCELMDIIVSEENIEEDFFKKEEKNQLRKALKKLSEKEKEIIYWFYYENKTLQDYSIYKGINYRTAVGRKKKALIKLKSIIQGEL